MDIGFIGLGNMGYGMASNILKAKHNLTVHDLRSSTMDKLVASGAKAGKNASEVAANCEIVFTSLPGPNEIEDAKKIDAITITNNRKALNIMELAGLIKKSSFVISNDTGPAHMTAHLGMSGLALFGYHTTPQKVSIETDKFKALTVKKLTDLSAETVYSEIKSKLELITH